MTERKYRILVINYDELLELLKLKVNLPLDVKIISTSSCVCYDLFNLSVTLESESYDPVSMDAIVPKWRIEHDKE